MQRGGDVNLQGTLDVLMGCDQSQYSRLRSARRHVNRSGGASSELAPHLFAFDGGNSRKIYADPWPEDLTHRAEVQSLAALEEIDDRAMLPIVPRASVFFI
jgi:hypothetical protein